MNKISHYSSRLNLKKKRKKEIEMVEMGRDRGGRDTGGTSQVTQWTRIRLQTQEVSVPGLGRSPAGGNGKLLQYSCLENPVERGA